MRFSERKNRIHPEFQRLYTGLKEHFFSRNTSHWPVFSAPEFRHVLAERRRQGLPESNLRSYPRGAMLRAKLGRDSRIPMNWRCELPERHPILELAASLSKNWEDPSSVENVVSMPSDPALYGSMMGLLANANLVHEEYAGLASELEQAVVRQIANLAGYSPEKAAGIFTQGGTFCNLYGYLLGLRKSLPEAKHFGMGYTHDYRIIYSQGGHYSNTINLSLLGVNIREKTIRIKIKDNNDIDVDDFKHQLESCFRLKCVVPGIMLTLGTTDTFGLDRIKPIHDIRDSLCAHYGIRVKPHIHADSAIGWTMLFFLDYDFHGNPLCINDQTLEGLRFHQSRVREIRYADSFTVDFQKWGYVPYTSSLVMIRNGEDLNALENDPENYTYFEKSIQGRTHLQSTIECSRGAVGVFGAYAGLQYMGVRGFQVIIAYCLQNANYFRLRLKAFPFVKLLSPENQGPSVGFRIYDPERVKDADAEFHAEYRFDGSGAYWKRLRRNSTYHRKVFLKRGKVGLYTNWVESIAHSDYDGHENFALIPGEKAVFMNPNTSRREIDLFIERMLG